MDPHPKETTESEQRMLRGLEGNWRVSGEGMGEELWGEGDMVLKLWALFLEKIPVSEKCC